MISLRREFYTNNIHNWPFELNFLYEWLYTTIVSIHPPWSLLLYYQIKSDQGPCKMLDETTYPFQNFKDCTIEVWQWISNFILQKI